MRALRPSILARLVARPLVLALLCGAPVVGIGEALAADVFEEGPLVEVLPTGTLRGGETRELRVLALGVDGAALDDLDLEVSVDKGSVGELVSAGDGLYAVPFTAPADAGSVSLTLKGKTADKQSVRVDATLKVVAALGPIEASADPPKVVLGRDAATTLKADTGSEQGVRVRASAGTVGKPVRRGTSYTAQLTLPKVNFPQVSIVTWADAAEPHRRTGYQVIPLSGAVAFPVKGPAGASVLLQVDGREFGPVELDDAGKGKVPIEVPPGINEATQIVIDGDETTESTLALGIPPTRRLSLMPVAAAWPADGTQTVPVRVVVVTATGEPDEGAAPELTASAGSLGAVKGLGDGVYEALLTLPDTAGPLTLTAALPDSEPDRDELVAEVVAGLGPALRLTSDPADLSEGDGVVMLDGDADATVVIEGATRGERSVEGSQVRVEVTGAKGDGFVARGVPAVAASPNPAHTVVLLPAASRVRLGGMVGMLVAAVDAYGLPVPGTRVALDYDGGGTGPEAVTTGDDGTAWVLVGGTSTGLLKLSASAGAAEGQGAVVVATEGAAVPALWGSHPVVSRWAATHPVLGGAPAPAVDAPVAKPSRRFVMVEADGEAVAGEELTVTVLVIDEQGAPVPDLVPQLTSSAGTVSPPSEPDDEGRVMFVVAVPRKHKGGVTLTAEEPGGVEEVLELGGGEAVEPAELTFPAPDHPWLRVRASGVVSSYRYEQAPSDDPGGLLPATMSVGGESGSAASPAGLELDGRLYLDDLELPYLGFHGSVRATWYAIEADLFAVPATDQLLDVEADLLLRYPFDSGSDRFWVGGRAGFRYDDFILFEGCLEPSCVLEYSAVGVPGLGLGPELGAEVGRLFLVGGYSFGLANFSQPYSHSVDLEVGVHVVKTVYVDLGFTSLSRRVELRGAETDLLRGEVSDSQMIGKLGVGFAL